MKWFFASFLALLIIVNTQTSWAEESVPLGPQYVVLRTNYGDMIVGLYNQSAPHHANYFLKLVRAGLYNSVPLFRVVPNFVIQFAGVKQRQVPLTEKEIQLIQNVPDEFSSAQHLIGRLSMAREDFESNSSESSFSILLNDAPHLDGKYSVFGEVVRGIETLRAFARLAESVSKNQQLPFKIFIESAEVIDFKTAQKIALKEPPLPANFAAVPYSNQTSNSKVTLSKQEIQALVSLNGFGLFCLLLAIAFLNFGPDFQKWGRAIGLLSCVVFVLQIELLLKLSNFLAKSGIAILGFFLFLILFRFLGFFESKRKSL